MKQDIMPLVVANWKMNPISSTQSSVLAVTLKKALVKIKGVDVVIAPPIVYLDVVSRIHKKSSAFSLGVQNIHHEKLGAHTGEISLSMIKEFGTTHCILGHSERRASGESDVQVNQKLLATIKAGLTGILCVGETKRDQSGHYLSHIETQIRTALAQVTKTSLSKVVIAYEPIWAIGTGKNATSADVHEMKLFIERILSDMYGRNFAQKVRILYGGSVHGKNAHELFSEGMVNGFLVGGASLHADEFIQIVNAVRTV